MNDVYVTGRHAPAAAGIVPDVQVDPVVREAASVLYDDITDTVDLLDPFKGGLYYNRAMGGSFSIKSVLPAIFPDDPALNYHNLEDIHNGTEAMTIFPQIQYMSPEEQARTRHNQLKYCELDTYAMVKVWEELNRAING